MKIQIQIVNYKTKNYVIECVKTVLKDLESVEFDYVIKVLENGSGEDLSDLNLLFPNNKIDLVTSEKNLGFGGGNNLLAKNSEADYILLLNPDIKIIEPNTISNLLNIRAKLNAQVVGPRLVTENNRTQKWDHGELKGVMAKISNNSGGSYWKEQKKISEVAWVSGAVFLIENKSFKELGGFDENFFLYKEEEELCLRLRNIGGKIIYNPEITVFHKGGVIAKKSDHMQKLVDYFLDKHFKNRFGYKFYKILNKIVN